MKVTSNKGTRPVILKYHDLLTRSRNGFNLNLHNSPPPSTNRITTPVYGLLCQSCSACPLKVVHSLCCMSWTKSMWNKSQAKDEFLACILNSVNILCPSDFFFFSCKWSRQLWSVVWMWPEVKCPIKSSCFIRNSYSFVTLHSSSSSSSLCNRQYAYLACWWT